MKTRKEVRSLTDGEKKKYVAAIIELKKDGVYDALVRSHAGAMDLTTPWIEETPHPSLRNGAHRGPVFLPWHREFLRRLEDALGQIDSDIAIPYWNWTLDADMEKPEDAPIWAEDFMGGGGTKENGWEVTTGAFAFSHKKWRIVEDEDGPELRRSFGFHTPSLPNKADVRVAMNERSYDSAPWGPFTFNAGFRICLEGWVRQSGNHRFRDNNTQLHNRVHVWVGGSMLLGTSPNDPVFFLHHCYVDKIWADWQAKQLEDNPKGSPHYLPANNGPKGHRLKDPMHPWIDDGVTPESVLDHHKLGYRFDTEEGVFEEGLIAAIPKEMAISPETDLVRPPDAGSFSRSKHVFVE